MQHLFENVLESLRQGILLLDSRNTVTFHNVRVTQILGLAEGVIRSGMSVDALWEVTGEPAQPEPGTRGAGWWKTGIRQSFQLALSDRRMVSLTCAPSNDGGWLLTYDDVSTLARVEGSLAEQHKRFDAALNNMPHGLCMFDATKALILCNAAYARMYDLPERLTRAGTPLDHILEYRRAAGNGPANSATYFHVVDEAKARGSIASQNIVLADRRVIKITHNPMENGGYVATHEDVTETVRLAEELVQHRDMLEVTVQKRTAEIARQALELERMLDQERHINELQRQFVAMASHEFRTPLAIIDASAQRLQRRKAPIDAEFVGEKAEQIRNSVTRIVDLMESILSAGRLDTGKIDINYETCALGALITTCCDRQATITKSHRFQLDLERLPEFIDADRNTLTQVFTNLLSNAVKYAPSAPEIRVTGWEEAGLAKVSVSDDGVGIDPEDLPRMFQRYFRARTSTGIAGTGIGLNLVKQIVELHGGSIEITSARGRGSTFTVTLPITANCSAAAASHIDAA